MLIPKKARIDILSYLFKEGVLVAKKDLRCKHPDIDVPNLFVMKLMQSMKSRKFVRESFTWNHFYWYLTNDGINYLREFLHLPEEIVPATLKKRQQATGSSAGAGGRPVGGGRGGPGPYPRGGRPGKDAGPDGDFKPRFDSGGGRGRFQDQDTQ